jgi:2-dehydropantoate 2-reductase
MTKTIAVLGTGANGSCTAASLVEAGIEVMLIDQWPAHVEAMRANGLRIDMPDRSVTVPVSAYHLADINALNPTLDVVFLATKSYDTRWAAEFIKTYLAADGLLVGLQNAMTAETIADIVGPERTVGVVVELSSEIFTPGIVQRNTVPAKTWFGVGAFHPAHAERVAEIADLLRNVGKVAITDNVLAGKWMKLVINTMCLGPMAMLGLTLSEAVRLPGVRELTIGIGTEALAVGQKLGHPVEPIFGLKPEDLGGSNQLLEKLFDKLAADIGPRARDCVLQDHLKGRYSEVDDINGRVVDEGQKLGIPAPANAAIVEITRRIRAGELKPDPTNLALAANLAMAASAKSWQ